MGRDTGTLLVRFYNRLKCIHIFYFSTDICCEVWMSRHSTRTVPGKLLTNWLTPQLLLKVLLTIHHLQLQTLPYPSNRSQNACRLLDSSLSPHWHCVCSPGTRGTVALAVTGSPQCAISSGWWYFSAWDFPRLVTINAQVSLHFSPSI